MRACEYVRVVEPVVIYIYNFKRIYCYLNRKLLFKGSNRGRPVEELDIPEPPGEEFFIGFSCLGSTSSRVGEKSCGVYFEALIEAFEDGFPKPMHEKRFERTEKLEIFSGRSVPSSGNCLLIDF